MESTNIRVKLNSVEQVRQFVETMRKYDGDVDGVLECPYKY